MDRIFSEGTRSVNRRFELDLTPSVARQLVRLKELYPETVLSPEITKMAEESLVRMGEFDGTIEQGVLMQDLLDFDFRAVLVVSRHVTLKTWLHPVLWACQRAGLKKIAFLRCATCFGAPEIAEKHGFDTYVVDKENAVRDEDDQTPRDAVMVMNTKPPTYAPASRDLVPLSLEFPRTIIVGEALNVSTSRLFPKLPTLIAGKEPLGDHPSRRIAFLFNTSYAMGRVQE
jgi:hypothetical protein